MTEQRITDELKQYWEGLRGSKPFPSESQIDSDALASIWHNCFLVKREHDKFVYDFLGDSIIEAYGDNKLGENVIEDEIYPESPGVINKFQEVLDAKQPIYYEGAFINKNNLDIKFRKILLPLGAGAEVEYILGGMRWKSMDL